MLDYDTLDNFALFYKSFKSPYTIIQYKKYIKQFMKIINKPLEEVTKKDVRKYIVLYLNTGKSVQNIKVTLSAMKLFVKYINYENDEDILNTSVFEKHELPSVIMKKQRYTLYNDIKKILKVLNNIDNNFVKLRSRAAIYIFATTGARRLEVAEIEVSNIDFKNNRILFTRTKNRNSRYVNVPRITMAMIRRYMLVRNESQYSNNKYLFVSQGSKNKRLEILINLYNYIKKYIPDFTFHSMRRGYASELINNNVPLIDVSITLGHKGIDTTVKHYITLNDKRLDKSRKKHPAFKKEKSKKRVTKQKHPKIIKFNEVVSTQKENKK